MPEHADKSHNNLSRAVANQPSPKKEGGKAAFSFVDNRPGAAVSFVDNRPESKQIDQIQAMMNNSSRTKQLVQLQEIINNSPRTKRQNEQIDRMFGTAAQWLEPPQEEELQMKVERVPVQQQAVPEDEELQMKAESDPAQRQPEPEEEELIQGKFAPVQRQTEPEDEELIQGNFEPAQRQEIEDDELAQGKFATSEAPAELQNEPGPKQSNTGLPDNLKAGIENLSGVSLYDVNVHYNSVKPAQLQALAYTQGTDIHVAPGQEKHLPHEAWHVVQQRKGRVKPTLQAKGVPINDDAGLEREADAMGAKALQSQTRDDTEAETCTPSPRASVVQRAIGMEIESSTDWQAYDAVKQEPYKQVTGEHRLLWQQASVRLETELSGKLEFVIEPPANTTDDLVRLVERAQDIAGLLLKARTEKAKGFDEFALALFMKQREQSREKILRNKALLPYVIKKINLFQLEKAVPSAQPVYISSGSSFPGGFQATVGVHLSAVPALFEWMKDVRSFPKPELLTGAQETSKQAREHSIGLPFTWYNQMSPSMEGLLNLVYYYISAGDQARERRPFPKGITQVMARTNFAKMFSMTPESAFFSARPEYWVRYVSEAGGFDPGQRIFQGSFGDTAQDVSIIDLTRGQWLLDMVGTAADLGQDLLSVSGGGPELLKTMGDLDKTDDLGATEDSDRGVILELRGLDAYTIPLGQWGDFARKIGDGVDELNQRQQNSIERLQANQDVAEAGQGAKLFWSPWSAEVRGGKDVYAMAIEAYKAPFRSQVKALITRARARAKEAIDLREFG